MAPTFVQESTTNFPFAAHGATFTSSSMTLTAGNLAVLIFDMGGLPSGSVLSVIDSQGNNYTNAVKGNVVHSANSGFFTGYGNFTDIWYSQNVVGGAGTVTVTVSATGSNNSTLYWLEYSGARKSGAAIGYITAQSGTQTGTGTISLTTVGTGNGTDNIVVAFLKNDGSNGTAWSYTDRSAGFGTPFAEAGDQASSAPSGEAVTMTVSGTSKWGGVAIVFTSSPADAGATFVQELFASNGGGSSLTSGTIATTTGNMVIVELIIGNSLTQTATSVTDGTNTFTKLASSHAFNSGLFGGCSTEIWYAINVTGTSHTIAASGWGAGGGFNQMQISEYSSSPTWGVTDPIDTSNGATGGSGTPLISLTLAQVNELVVGGFVLTVPASWLWTNAINRTGVGGASDMRTTNGSWGDHQPVTSAGYSVTGTGGASTAFVGSAAAFKVPVAAAANVKNSCMMMGVGV